MNSSLRILIVEDEPLTALTIEEKLTEAGYEICGKAADCESAIRFLIKESPDLALIDIYLGKGQLDGIVTARELMRIKPIPIIYLTGHTEPETFSRAKKTNPLAFLHKPFRPAELADQIELALHNFYHGEKAEMVGMSDHLYVLEGQNKLLRVNHEGILMLKAEGAYTEFFLTHAEFSRLYPEKIYRSTQPLLMSVGFGHLFSNWFVGECEVTLPEGGHKALIDRLNIIRSRKKK